MLQKSLFVVLCVTPLLSLSARQGMEALDDHKRVVDAAAGSYDMSEERRRYPFLLILEQEALRYPSFWAGGHGKGEVSFLPQTDMLSGGLDFNAKGGFTLRVTQSTHKRGMETSIPGGPWMTDTRERNFKIHFDGFRDAEVGEMKGRQGGGTVEVIAKAQATVEVDGVRAPVEARVRFVFEEETPHFTFHAEFTFKGADLGLRGDQAGPVRARISTLSPPGKPAPPPAFDADDPLMDLGL